MKKLIYRISGFSYVYNEETGEVERNISLSEVTVENPTDRDIERAEEISYNGEYYIDDDGQPEPEQKETSVWDELDAAYQEGVDSV